MKIAAPNDLKLQQCALILKGRIIGLLKIAAPNDLKLQQCAFILKGRIIGLLKIAAPNDLKLQQCALILKVFQVIGSPLQNSFTSRLPAPVQLLHYCLHSPIGSIRVVASVSPHARTTKL